MCNMSKQKRHTQKYGYLTLKDLENNPWETLCVDLIGPYGFYTKEKNYRIMGSNYD